MSALEEIPMEKNDFLLYNEIIYHIHTCQDMDDLKRSILAQVKLMIQMCIRDRDISRGVFRRGLCRPAVLPAVGRPAAERRALRPHPCPDPQNHLLKNSHKIVGIFQTPT